MTANQWTLFGRFMIAAISLLRGDKPDVWGGVDTHGLLGDISESMRPQEPVTSLEQRVEHWIQTRVGPEYLHPKERAMRLLEEAVELAQAEGITQEMIARQVAHVYERPAGAPYQEAGGVAVCLLGWCASHGTTFEAVAYREIERIENKPLAHIRGSLARKQDADLVHGLDDGGVAR